MDLPAAKRQRTETYHSDNDSGDDLFANFVPDTPAKWETQPTQILDRSRLAPSSASPDIVQVPASSPPPPQPPVRSSPKLKSLANAMAPAGTVFRPPMSVSRPTIKAPATIDLLSDDEMMTRPVELSSSDDELTLRSVDIKPSTFGKHVRRNSRESSLGASARFQNVIQNSVYDPLAKRSHQSRPERAMPVAASSFSDNDFLMETHRQNVTRLRILYPQHTISKIADALAMHNNRFDETASWLGGDRIRSGERIPTQPSKPQPQMKRGLEGPVASIKDRYSTSRKHSTQLQTRSPAAPLPKRRKLMQGRKHASSPVSSPVKPVVITLDSEEELAGNETDSALGSEPEADSELEKRLLDYFNTCGLEDLIELTSTPRGNAETMIAARPFRSLDAAREVTNGKTLKSGKKGVKSQIGDRIVDVAMDMFSGYEAVDALVEKCEEMGKSPAQEMATWGLDVFGDAKNGELELTSFDDERDSGIGSPSSLNTSFEDDVQAKARRSRRNLLKQPDMMAEGVEMKDYQIVGLNWLSMMYRHKLSCMLADGELDMLLSMAALTTSQIWV